MSGNVSINCAREHNWIAECDLKDTDGVCSTPRVCARARVFECVSECININEYM